MKKFLAKLREPIVTDRSVDLLASLAWACFAWWGLASVLVGIPSISSESTPLYEAIWGGWIGVTSLIASLSAFSTFFHFKRITRAFKKKAERLATLLMLVGVVVYPSVIITKAFYDPNYVAVAGIAVFYTLLPIWRALHLSSRIRTLKELAPNNDAG